MLEVCGGTGRFDGAHGRLGRLTRTAALETHPVWSPDGRRIAFTSGRHANRGRLELLGPAFELYTMRADGRDVRRITRNRVADLHPNWQPIMPAPVD